MNLLQGKITISVTDTIDSVNVIPDRVIDVDCALTGDYGITGSPAKNYWTTETISVPHGAPAIAQIESCWCQRTCSCSPLCLGAHPELQCGRLCFHGQALTCHVACCQAGQYAVTITANSVDVNDSLLPSALYVDSLTFTA